MAAGSGVPSRVNVLGVGVSAINMGEAVGFLDERLLSRQPTYVCVTGVHGVMESQKDPALRAIHNAAGLVTPDGMPMVWLGRLQGRAVDRVYGPDLMLELCRHSLASGYRHYFYGGGPGVAEHLVERLAARFPGLSVAGHCCPPFRDLSEAEDAEIVAGINAAAPDIVWVGLSTPKQERWMAAHVGRLSAPVMVGVGAAFDFHAGLKRQAPRWMQKSGLEWFFRMMTEPKRLAGRYLRNNPRFVALVLSQLTGLRRFDLEQPQKETS